MMMLPCAFWPLAEHASFGQNCFDASIGSVHVCICYSMPMDACFFNHSFPFHRIVGFYQLAHVELFTPKPDDTLWFFKDLLGLEESGREGQSVYLRAYEDFYHHTLKVTEAPQAGSGHVAWRTTSPQALERRVKAIEATGLGKGWIEGDLGHGRAYQFTTPDGHKMELLWDVDYYQAPPEKRT